MNYSEAKKLLHGRCINSRKMGNNTYLKRRTQHLDEPIGTIDAFAIQLHATDVLTFFADGTIELNNGGYPTCTTHDRMNEYLPAGYRVSGEPLETRRNNGGMSVLRHGTWQTGTAECLVDNRATIHPDGTISGGDVAAYREDRREERLRAQRPRNRARYWMGKVNDPDALKTSRNLTVEKILAEENATVRVAKMRIYGMERFFLEMKPDVIDTHGEYSLLRLNLRGVGQTRNWSDSIVALKMTCPSTGACYLNMVPPHVRTVAEALDYMFDTTDYLGQITQQS